MSEAHFQHLAINEVFNDSNQIVCIVDPDMMVRWFSPSAARYGLDTMLNRSIVEVIHPDDLDRAAQAFDGQAQLESFEPSLMANSVITLRVVAGERIIPFDASGRWVTDANGDQWLIGSLHDVTTRHATERVLRTLAAGADAQGSMQAVISAVREFAGVTGAQMIWNGARGLQTFGDATSHTSNVLQLWGDLSRVSMPGAPVEMISSDWGYALPVLAGRERLGSMVLWGVGTAPELAFVAAALSPLLDLAAVSLKRARELAELERRATTDQVTGLVNRHAFFGHLDRLVEQAAIMYIDLDGFKEVNDTYGHTLGDRLLGVVSRRIGDAVGAGNVVGRLGGDEFGVLVPAGDAAEARRIGQRIIEALNQTFVIDGHRIATGAGRAVVLANF